MLIFAPTENQHTTELMQHTHSALSNLTEYTYLQNSQSAQLRKPYHLLCDFSAEGNPHAFLP